MLLPGDPERAAQERTRREGIPISDELARGLDELATRLGVLPLRSREVRLSEGGELGGGDWRSQARMQDKRRWLPSWQRVELVELCLKRGVTRRQAAVWRRVSVSTVQYWVDRYRRASADERASGEWALDRPSTPSRQPARVSDGVHDRVCEVRRRTGWGPRLIAAELGMAHATVSRCLARRGLSRIPRAPREQVRRFEWPCPGDLLQMDTKRLARFTRPGHAVTGEREKRARWARSSVTRDRRPAAVWLHRDVRHRRSRARAGHRVVVPASSLRIAVLLTPSHTPHTSAVRTSRAPLGVSAPARARSRRPGAAPSPR